MSVLRIEYLCTNGHYHATNEPLDACLCYVHGKRCTGEMKRIGRGSRKANREPKQS